MVRNIFLKLYLLKPLEYLRAVIQTLLDFSWCFSDKISNQMFFLFAFSRSLCFEPRPQAFKSSLNWLPEKTRAKEVCFKFGLRNVSKAVIVLVIAFLKKHVLGRFVLKFGLRFERGHHHSNPWRNTNSHSKDVGCMNLKISILNLWRLNDCLTPLTSRSV